MSKQLTLDLFENVEDSNMHTIVSSEIKIYNPTESIKAFCYKNYKLKNPQYEYYRKNQQEKYAESQGIEKYCNCFKYDNVKDILYIPFGLLHSIWGYLKKFPYEICFNKTDDISIKNVASPETLYDYQEAAVAYMIQEKGGVLVSPCGSGKTRMGIEIIHRIGKKFLWLTHTKDLLDQTYNAMKHLYPELKLGRICGDEDKTFGEDGTIAMVQSLSRIDAELYGNLFEVVVADECAHAVGTGKDETCFAKILNNVSARYKYGLTATPSRSDDLINSMYMYLGTNKNGKYEPMYKVPKEVVKTNPAQLVRIDLDTILNEKQFTTNAYKKDKPHKINFVKLISVLSEDDERTDAIIDQILQCSLESRKQVVLCSRVEHAEKFASKLLDKGIRAKAISASTKKSVRQELLSKESTWQVLCATYNLLKEGNDIPTLDTLHLAVPLVSKSTITQAVGRIERFCDNKKTPIAYDYVDKNLKYLEIAHYRRQKALKEGY